MQIHSEISLTSILGIKKVAEIFDYELSVYPASKTDALNIKIELLKCEDSSQILILLNLMRLSPYMEDFIKI